MTNAKTPGARCYGFVTLSSAEDANRSIENLHQTELHGRVISVERVSNKIFSMRMDATYTQFLKDFVKENKNVNNLKIVLC